MASNISAIREKWVRKCVPLFSKLLYVAVGVLIGLLVFHGGSSPKFANRGELLFRKGHLTAKAPGLYQKIKHARRLAKEENSEVWVVLLLLDNNLYRYFLHSFNLTHPESLSPVTQERIKTKMEKAERGIIAEVLMNIPENAHKAVLWAVTTKLLDHGRGYGLYSHTFGLIHGVGGETEPIRDIARKTLRRCLGVDHGYNVPLWREAILQKRDSPRKQDANEGDVNTNSYLSVDDINLNY